MSNAQRIILIALAGAVIVASLILFTPEDDEEPRTAATQATQTAPTGRAVAPRREPADAVTTIQIRGGKPDGGVKTVDAAKGERIRIRVSSAEEDEIHLHGYDITRQVAPGEPARFDFEAKFEGVFELEVHSTHNPIATLRIRPD